MPAAKKSTPRKAAGKAPAPAPASRPAQPVEEGASDGPHVVVRMYNVGFGDCFLIEYPGDGGYVHRILIDCGSTAAAAPAFSMSDVVDTLLADVADDDGKPRIDVVVCTHRHADHVSGFARASWKEVKVKEVWFPWTEDPKDNEARRIRESQSRLALAVQQHWQARLAANAGDPDANRWLDLAVNALSNESAMSTLHGGFKSKPKRLFLSSDGSPTPVATEVLTNISAFVLGPSNDEAIIRDMDPPAGTTYLRQIAGEQPSGEAFEPFAEDWLLEPKDYQWTNLVVGPGDAESIQRAAQEWDPAVAVALEQAVNGTSLVLAFEIDDVVLFFPGDAQWGTWNAFLKNGKSKQLLSRAKFWKVGHHGSHNATPIDFLENTASPACCAMMSTRTGKFASIPRVPLVDAIAQKGLRLARSDQPDAAPAKPFWRRTPSIIEAKFKLGART
jgi:beta-lactamase superfamily II metal-dependent hydrolase